MALFFQAQLAGGNAEAADTRAEPLGPGSDFVGFNRIQRNNFHGDRWRGVDSTGRTIYFSDSYWDSLEIPFLWEFPLIWGVITLIAGW